MALLLHGFSWNYREWGLLESRNARASSLWWVLLLQSSALGRPLQWLWHVGSVGCSSWALEHNSCGAGLRVLHTVRRDLPDWSDCLLHWHADFNTELWGSPTNVFLIAYEASRLPLSIFNFAKVVDARLSHFPYTIYHPHNLGRWRIWNLWWSTVPQTAQLLGGSSGKKKPTLPMQQS